MLSEIPFSEVSLCWCFRCGFSRFRVPFGNWHLALILLDSTQTFVIFSNQISKLCPEADVDTGVGKLTKESCVICELIIEHIYSSLKVNSTLEEIEKTLETVCDYSPYFREEVTAPFSFGLLFCLLRCSLCWDARIVGYICCACLTEKAWCVFFIYSNFL